MTDLEQRIEALQERSEALQQRSKAQHAPAAVDVPTPEAVDVPTPAAVKHAPLKTVMLTDSQIHTALNTIDSAGDYNGITTLAQLNLQRVLRAALRTP